MRFVLLFALRLMGFRLIFLVLIIVLTAQMIHLSQKWHWLPKYTVLEAAETRYSTLKSLWESRPHIAKESMSYSDAGGFMDRLKGKIPFDPKPSLGDEVAHHTMGITSKKMKQLPLSQVPGQLQGLYVAQQDETVASHCLISLRGVAILLSVGDSLLPGVVVTQITNEGVVLREHGKLTQLLYRKIN